MTDVTFIERPCPHQDPRPDAEDISLLVVHNISLPPGQFYQQGQGRCYIDDFFAGQLDATADPYFAGIAAMRVSAHCVIFRDGTIHQYVPFAARAWHAGLSVFDGRDKCNDFAIGIELEGTDDLPYTMAQYQQLAALSRWLMQRYPAISAERIVGHCDIAPGRKTDPGPAFDWALFRRLLNTKHEMCEASQAM